MKSLYSLLTLGSYKMGERIELWANISFVFRPLEEFFKWNS